jgi:RND family efflux transporter MFP subunit
MNGMNVVYRLFYVAVLVIFLGEGFFITALASVPGQIGPYRLQIFAEPAVIPVGKARLRIDVTDAAGKPVDGAEIRSLVQMPAMSMGEKETLAQPLPGKPGSYSVEARFAMAGRFAASLSIRGPLGEANGKIDLETGQDTGSPEGKPPVFSLRSLQPWLLVALLALAVAFVLFRMRRTGQRIGGRSLLSREKVVGVLLILIGFGASRWAVNRWRRPGAMTPIEAQSMEMNTPAPPGVALVTLAEASRGPIESTVWYPGQAIALNEQDVITRTEGWLSWMPFYVGQQVRPDQVVAHLDINQSLRGRNDALEGAQAEITAVHEERTGAEADLASKQSMIAEAEAMIAAMEADRQFWQQQSARNKALLDKGALSSEEYQREAAMAANATAKVQQAAARLDQARAEVRAAEAMVRRADALIAAAEKKRQQMASDITAGEAAVTSEAGADLEEAHAATNTNRGGRVEIRAHIGGVVTERRIALGQHVGPGQSILKIAQTDPIRLQANVAEADLARIKLGYPVAIRGRSATEPTVFAKVTSIAPTVDPSTRTGIVEALAPNRNMRFRPGQSVALDISTGKSEDALRVPLAAVHVRAETGTGPLAGGSANYVWLAEKSSGSTQYIVTPVDVTTGVTNGVNVQILSGLQPGQKVVAVGGDYLKRGDAVSVSQVEGAR